MLDFGNDAMSKVMIGSAMKFIEPMLAETKEKCRAMFFGPMPDTLGKELAKDFGTMTEEDVRKAWDSVVRAVANG